jgi:membrane protein
MMAALNIAYEEPERRGLLQYYLNSFTFTIIGILGGLIMLLAILYVPILFAFTGFSYAFELLVSVLRWPFLALFVLFMLAFLYRYGPCRRSAKWHWVSVGSLFAMLVWLIASFSLYVANFANYDRLYGSLGAVIILLFWLYISFSSYCSAPKLTPSSSCRRRRIRPQAGPGRWASGRPLSPTTWPVDLTGLSDR